jgi:phage tail-like protein
MRGTVEGLPNPHPISGLLPAFMQEDDFTVRMTEGLDAVLAPLVSVLDCLDAYVDPMLAPDDFVPWLASWVGATVDSHWADQRVRLSIVTASEMHRLRGTVEGVRAQLVLATGGDIEVLGSGGIELSSAPTDGVDEGDPHLVIRIAVDDPAAVRLSVVEELVDSMKPAHVPHTIEVSAR